MLCHINGLWKRLNNKTSCGRDCLHLRFSVVSRITVSMYLCMRIQPSLLAPHHTHLTGPIQALRLGNSIIKWTTSERLLGVQVDDKLSWSVAKSFASKLSLLRRMRFLPQNQLEDFYTKVILPSVTYGLTVWGSCNKTHLDNLEKLHARAGRIVYGLPWDTGAEDVLGTVQ